MVDLTPLKSPVYERINDVPRVPTETEPGNGSDLIARFNQLCELLTAVLADVATTGEYSDLKNIPTASIRVQVNEDTFEDVKLLIIRGENITTYYSGQALQINIPDSSSSGGSGGGGYG